MKAFAAAATLFLAAGPAHAEWYGDIYGGWVTTTSRDVPEQIDNGVTPINHTFLDVRTDNGREYGARAGYWTSSIPWLGATLDFFHFKTRTPEQNPIIVVNGASVPATFHEMTFGVTGLSLGVAARYPLFRSAEYPNGRMQPYGSAGPALFYTSVTDHGHFAPIGQTASDWAPGIMVGAGLRFFATPQISVFAEWRATQFKAEHDFISTSNMATIRMGNDFSSRHALFGASYTF